LTDEFSGRFSDVIQPPTAAEVDVAPKPAEVVLPAVTAEEQARIPPEPTITEAKQPVPAPPAVPAEPVAAQKPEIVPAPLPVPAEAPVVAEAAVEPTKGMTADQAQEKVDSIEERLQKRRRGYIQVVQPI